MLKGWTAHVQQQSAFKLTCHVLMQLDCNIILQVMHLSYFFETNARFISDKLLPARQIISLAHRNKFTLY